MFNHMNSLLESIGQKRLSVYEMPNATVQESRLTNNPDWNTLTHQHGDLIFTGYQLAHAVIKADFLEYRNPTLPGIGFILQSHHFIDWVSTDFCLKAGAAKLLGDFARTGLTGRIGQGISLLFAHSKGYSFTAHLREYLEANNIPTRDAAGRALPIADFVFDGSTNARAIVESKASLSLNGYDPSSVKSLLKSALNNQVIPWMSRLIPPATKSFVVCSYLRERANSGACPSSLAFVDPENTSDVGEFELSPESVRRENYAAWLAAMGLIQEAERLRNRDSAGMEAVWFAVVKVREREFAFPIAFCPPFRVHHFPVVQLTSGCVVAGIHVDALHAVSRASQGDEKALVEYLGIVQESVEKPDNNWHSIFPDGTYFGNIDQSSAFQIIGVVL